MNFNFPNPTKSSQMIFRLSDEDAEFLRIVAKEKHTTITETINVFLRAAIEEYKAPKRVPFVPENCKKDCSHVEDYL